MNIQKFVDLQFSILHCTFPEANVDYDAFFNYTYYISFIIIMYYLNEFIKLHLIRNT